MDIFGPAIGIGKWAIEKLYDRFEAAHGVRLELEPGAVGYPDRSVHPVIILTVRNRGVPQKVEDVALMLSTGQYLLMPIPEPGFKPLPAIVTLTDSYQAGFPLDRVAEGINGEQARSGRPVGIIGARVRLASGRAVKLRKKIDPGQTALFSIGKG